MKNIFSEKVYLAISGSIFLLVAAFHLLRMLFQWKIVVGTFEVPFLLSYSGFPTAAAYSAWAFWLIRKERKPV